MTTIVVVLGIAATVGVVTWFFLAQQLPQRAARHEPAGGANKRRTHSRTVADRPAGPDAESMDASRPGGATPPPPPPHGDGPPSDTATEREAR